MQYGCYVYGIDLSVNMILTALETAAAGGNGDKISFEVSDATKRQLPEHSFDAIFSRDTILHISNKQALFDRLFKLLKPGGRLVISDYCRSESPPSDAFAAYINTRQYTLCTIHEFGEMLKKAGFVDVKTEDKTKQLGILLKKELNKVKDDGDAFVNALGKDALEKVLASWKGKLERVEAGEHQWGLFYARKE